MSDPNGPNSTGARGNVSAATVGTVPGKRPRLGGRRRLLRAAAALAVSPWLPARGAEGDAALPDIPELTSLLAGRKPRWERIQLILPRLADNGLSVSMKVTVDGPFSANANVRSIHLFSERNPVPQIALFEFPLPLPRVEVESRVRLNGTQRLVAVATMSDGALLAAGADVIVTAAACLDES